jgi:hypothetical protein
MASPAALLLLLPAVAPGDVDFDRDLAPVLAERCLKCHGEDRQRAGLRLDSAAGALRGADNGEVPVVVPFDPDASRLLEVLVSDDEDERMPPKGPRLTDEEVERFRRWIAAGAPAPGGLEAPFELHWAYAPPRRPEVPTTDSAWVRNEVDAFVLERLTEVGLEPAPEADRATLARRLALDLTGLPLEPAELDAFLDDPRPDAYERLVERLLGGEAHAEHLARRWLDLARYADTNGYEKDDRREIWRWRDWVIGAIAEDLSYDEFTIRQLAGDLLPEATLEDRVATGFHRNTMVNAEGGVDQEEYRVAAVVDRVDTTASVWLGTTMACARCHAHKYDPFSQRDYYRLLAYFNSTADVGPGVGPTIEAPTPEQRAAEERARAELAELEGALTAWTPALDRELRALLAPHAAATTPPARDDATLAEVAAPEGFAPPGWGDDDGAPGADEEAASADGGPSPGARDDGAPAAGADGPPDGEAADDQAAPTEGSSDAGPPGDDDDHGGWNPVQADLSQDFSARGAAARPLEVVRVARARAEQGSTLELDPATGVVAAGGEAPATDVYVLEFELGDRELTTLELDVLAAPELPGGGPGRPAHGNFVLSELVATLVRGEERRPVRLARALADHHQRGTPVWAPEHAIDGERGTGWAVGGGIGRPHRLLVGLAEPLRAPGATLELRLEQFYGGQHLIARLDARLSSRPLPAHGLVVPPDLEPLVAGLGTLSWEDRARLEGWFQERAPSLAALRARRDELEARARPATTLVMQELPEPRETRVLEGGSFLSPGERVEPGTPGVLPPLPADARPDRLGLARWIASPDNPLTARVEVNRLWELVFGRGLVATSDDLGTQGEPPTHPALLDWLAVTFAGEDGWSRRAVLRRIVTSATYRQSAATTPEKQERDPDARWLSRSPRPRLEVEVLRDQALAVSGLLAREVGGPSVMPPQPEGIWRATYSGDRWRTAEGADRHRRGLYTFWRRTAPYPSFTTFDAPSRELTCARRPRTNTPLQALVLLNDPAFVECAVALGARAAAEGGASDDERLAFAFRLCTARAPEADELAVLREVLAAERARLAADPGAAEALLAAAPGLDRSLAPPAELAALGLVGSVLLNLDETVTRP